MADKIDENKRKKVVNNSNMNDYLQADHFGIDTGVFLQHDKILNSLDRKVRKLVLDKRKKEDLSTSSMDKMFNILKHSSMAGTGYLTTMGNYRSAKETQTSSGFRSLGELNTNPEELKVVDMYEQNVRNSFMQMGEFRIICKIVPEMRKVVTNVTRDVLNTNDVDKHFIKNIFTSSDDNGLDSEEVKAINSEIEEKVVKRHDLEDKIKQFINEALVTGAKPVAVIPYRDIADLIYNRLNKSNESMESYIDKVTTSESYYLPKISEMYTEAVQLSQENANLNEDDEPYSTKNIDIYDKIIGSSVEDLYNLELENFLKSKSRELSITKSFEDAKAEYLELEKSFEDDNSEVVKVKKGEIKREVLKIIHNIDSNLDIVNPVNSAIKLAKATLKQGWKFRKLHENIMDITTNADISRRSDTNILDTFDPNRIDETDDDLAKPDNKKKSKKDKKINADEDFLDDVLILDFEPENVIPIIVNGVHVDYYILEEEAYNAGFERNRKTAFSFMDIVKSLGVANDDAITGQGMGNVTDPALAGLPVFGQQINTMSISSSFSMAAQADDAIKRNEILRDVVLRTIGTKLKDKDLIENKVFRDCIMNLLRQGYILRKKVQFTNIPAGNMIYFAHNLSNNGLPKSIYCDTLFYCYIYISSLISSLMIKLSKSSYKDKVTFEVARDGNFALAAHMIDNGLSTRTTHGFNTFESIFTVLKNSVAHDRIIIPSVNGEDFIKYEQLDKMNDIDIDDEFTEKILYKILQQTDYPASSLNKLSEDEYSRSIVAQQIMYLNSLKEMQDVFGGQVSKLLKLCVKYTKFSDAIDKKIKDNIDDIDFSFSIPNSLYLTNSAESFDTVERYAETITKIYFSYRMDEESWKTTVDAFKLEVIKSKANNIAWIDYDELYEKILSERPKMELEKIKHEKRYEKIQEVGIDNPDDESSDDGGFDTGSDFGGGDDFGGDTGDMDFGGGEDGMGDFEEETPQEDTGEEIEF